MLAVFCGLPWALEGFVFGAYTHVHWSSYLALRNVITLILVAVFLTMTGGWSMMPKNKALELSLDNVNGSKNISQLQKREQYDYVNQQQQQQPLWIAILASATLGPIANTFRAASILGAQELEEYSSGSAGILSNIVSAAYIPMLAAFGYAFYGDPFGGNEYQGW